MIAPVHRLSKSKIVWLANHRCKHSHTYLEHYACFESEEEQEERVGILDIEASNLDANFGIMLTYCIKDTASDKIWSDGITKADVKKYKAHKRDFRIATNCVTDMKRFDRIVAHYGRRFDVPFIRTRALMLGVDFPPYSSLYMDDTWRWAKDKLKLNSNRLDTVCRSLFGETEKTHIDHEYWIRGLEGDPKAIEYIMDHNVKDVLDLEKVWKKLRDYVNINKSSI